MAKRPKENPRLRECRLHWEKHHEDWALREAVILGSKHPEPKWLTDAIYQVGRETILWRTRPKKEGRHPDFLGDYVLFSTVELHRAKGLKGEHLIETAANETDVPFDTIKKAWLRHRSRIKRFDPAKKTIYSRPADPLGFDIVQAYADLRFWKDK